MPELRQITCLKQIPAMTFRALKAQLNLLTEYELDLHISVRVGDEYFQAEEFLQKCNDDVLDDGHLYIDVIQ